MPTGVIMNALSVFFGGIVGAAAGKYFSSKLKEQLTLIFGICSLGMGISSIVLMKNMPAVIFSVIMGTALGIICHVGDWISKGAVLMQKPVNLVFSNSGAEMPREEFMSVLVTIIVLFCASATGIYGSIDAGMTGDHTIMISKSILDFFTALIFACNLGYVVSVIAIPQFLIFFVLFLAAKVIFPLTTPNMIADFKACGGMVLLATGFRIMKLKDFSTADMIPAMIIVMPFSYFWETYLVPLIS